MIFSRFVTAFFYRYFKTKKKTKELNEIYEMKKRKIKLNFIYFYTWLLNF